jgi:hypothetical protein
MHKSKNYDMATEVAMDKLMPKPIQITISMQGGGGLRGLGERPISSVYGRPIPRTIYRDNGGPIIRRFMGGYSDVDAGVEEVTGVSDIGGEPIPEEQRGGFGYTQEDVLRMQPNLIDDPTLAPSPTRPTPNRPEYLETSPEGSSIRQGTEGWTTRGFLNAFGVPFHPDRPTPRQEYAPKWQPQIQATGQGQTFQPLQPVPTAPIDQRSNEVIAAQDFVDRFLTPEDRNLPPINVEKLAGLPGGISGLFRSIDEGRWGVAVKDMANRNLHKGVAALKAMQDVKRDEEYFRRKKGGGGLSSVKKSININGQPHKLAWINPGEASALKAMGGSGKKVEGIPAYFGVGGWGTEDVDTGADDIGGETYVGDTGVSDIGGEGQYTVGDPYTYYQGVTSRGPTTAQQPSDTKYTGVTGKELGDVAPTRSTKDTAAATQDLGTGLFGEQYDFNDVKKVWMTQYIQSGRPRHDPVTQKPIDIEEEWQKAVKAPGGISSLAAGFKVGDPLGHQTQESFDIVNKQLKKKFKDARDDKAVTLDDDEEFEMTREELAAIVESAKVEGLDDFTPYSGEQYPSWMPGGMLVNFMSRTVIGTGTVGGVGVHLHKDGSITPISPEDSPGYDHESMKGENVEPIKRRRVPPPPASPSTLEPEAPAKGTMAELLARRGPTSKSGLQNLKNILASTHPGRDFNIG